MDSVRGMPTASMPDWDLPNVPSALQPGVARPDLGRASVREAAQQFEGYFLAYIMGVMRQTVPDGMFDSKAAKAFYSFYDAEIGRLAAESGGVGLAKAFETSVTHNRLKTEEYVPLKFGDKVADMTSGKVEGAMGTGQTPPGP